MRKPGTIYKLTIKDFVTYSDVEMYPGSNLNIVIGPNGTGKSTVVAAIILGLGGTPKTIGRGTKVSEYVKHDCSEARIDIELFGLKPGEMVTVTRIFNLNNHNTWRINNSTTTEQEVKNTIQKLNIQVNNLCQFLPQDRVQDFAKMDKKELLVNTQKAVGRQDLVDKHAQLIELRKEEKDMSISTEEIVAKLTQAKEDISRLEGKVQNLQEKQKIVGEINDVKRKICWENYYKVLKTKESVEDDKRQAEAIVNKHKKKIQPVENKLKGLRNEITITQNKILHIRNEIKTAEIKIHKLLEKAEEIDNSHSEVLVETRSKLQALHEYQTEIDAMRAKIDKLRNDENSLFTEYGEEKTILEKADKFLKAGNAYQAKSDELNKLKVNAVSVLKRTEAQINHMQEKLLAMENVKQQRLQILLRKDKDAYDAVMWLRENQEMFRGKIYEPIMVELNVLDPKHSKYLENIIPFRDRVAFTCEFREDMNKFLKTVGTRWRVNAVHSGAEHPALSSYRPNIPIEQLRKFGFFAYVSSLISGPEPVVKYLCKMYHLHNIPIGDQTVNNQSANVPQQIRLFFSDCHRFAVMASRYTGQRSTRISNVESDSTFSISIDLTAMNQIRRQLEELREDSDKMAEKVQQYDVQRQAFETKRLDILKQRSSLLQNIEQVKNLREKRGITERNLEERLRNFQTEEKIKQEANKRIKSIIKNSFKLHKTIEYNMKQYSDLIQKSSVFSLSLSNTQLRVTHLEEEHSSMLESYQSILGTLAEMTSLLRSCSAELEDSLQAAKKLSHGFTPNDNGFDRYRATFEALPSDMDALNGLVLEKQAKMECILTADEGELRQYEDKVKESRKWERQLDGLKDKLGEKERKIEALRKEWIEPLQQLVQRIDKNFSHFFSTLKCVGEVSLTHEHEEDYSSYGLTIRVTYRASEALQELNRYVQSGGERAVATALYLLALQDLTAAPFRCVDEINQGMDPQNERRVFEILSLVASEGGQYFLITPKLIPALQFGPNMKIHIVHNGPFCNVGKNFRFQNILEA